MKTIHNCFLIAALIAFAGWTGCSTPKTGGDAPQEPAKASEKQKEDPAIKRKALERKMPIAQARLVHAKMALDARESNAKKSIVYAEKELELAQAKLTHFQAFEAPNRTAKRQMDLKRAKDAAEEAAEELKQIEIMYDEADLEDMTSEFVINRGKRNAERRRQSLALEEQALESLIQYEIPREQSTLELEVEKKQDALKEARVEAESGLLQKKIEIMRIDAEIADLEDELAKLDEESKA